MTRAFVALLLLPFAACAHHGSAPARGRAAEGTAAAPADPAPVVDGDVVVASVRGMQILIKQVPSAEFVAGRLVIRGGVRNWDQASAGIEQLALAVAAHGGTDRLDKDAFARKLASLGAAVNAWSEEDFSVVAAKSPLAAWDETFDLMAGALLHPALPAAEIEVQRQAQIVRLKREQEMPDARLQVMAHLALYGEHPYGRRAVGTIENVSRFDAAALRQHLAKLREASRMLLVVVGNVDPKRVVAEAAAAFASLPRGNYDETALAPVQFARAKIVAEQRKLPTNYVQSLFPGPGWSDPDFMVASVAMSLLAEREWDEVRTKRNLSYAPSARFLTSALTAGLLYVTAVDPAATMKVMLDEARKLRDQPVPERELTAGKSVFLTRFLMGSESTDGQAALLARMQVQGGDWRRVRSLPDEVRAVSPEKVQAFARRWMGRWQTVVLGDPTKLDSGIFSSF